MLSHVQAYTIMFFTGGIVYCGLEVAYRGFSHFSMFLAGGLCFLMVGFVEHILGDSASVVGQMLLCGVMITAIELAVGMVVNRQLHMNVWDYSKQQYNFQGQICLLHANIWFWLSGPMIFCYDLMRHLLMGVALPRYKLF